MRQEDSNRQIVTQFLAAFSSGDVVRTMGMMAESATWWVAGTSRFQVPMTRPRLRRC